MPAIYSRKQLECNLDYKFNGLKVKQFYIHKVCTTSDKQISRTFQEFFKDKLQFSRTTVFLLNRRHSLTPFDHPIR